MSRGRRVAEMPGSGSGRPDHLRCPRGSRSPRLSSSCSPSPPVSSCQDTHTGSGQSTATGATHKYNYIRYRNLSISSRRSLGVYMHSFLKESNLMRDFFMKPIRFTLVFMCIKFIVQQRMCSEAEEDTVVTPPVSLRFLL